MRNAKTSKKMALVVLLMLIILCLSAFSFASSATSGVAENSTGVMGDVISKPVNNITTPNESYDNGGGNLTHFIFRQDGEPDIFLQVIYPKRITMILGDEIKAGDPANFSNTPRHSGKYGLNASGGKMQPSILW